MAADIGYPSGLRDTGFHPLDGARYLRSAGWETTVCDLVAHHAGSRFVAGLRGLGKELNELTYAESPVADALMIANQTIGPNGKPLSLDERMRDMLERHGPDSASARPTRGLLPLGISARYPATADRGKLDQAAAVQLDGMRHEGS